MLVYLERDGAPPSLPKRMDRPRCDLELSSESLDGLRLRPRPSDALRRLRSQGGLRAKAPGLVPPRVKSQASGLSETLIGSSRIWGSSTVPNCSKVATDICMSPVMKQWERQAQALAST